jgi:hypothetical protein
MNTKYFSHYKPLEKDEDSKPAAIAIKEMEGYLKSLKDELRLVKMRNGQFNPNTANENDEIEEKISKEEIAEIKYEGQKKFET